MKLYAEETTGAVRHATYRGACSCRYFSVSNRENPLWDISTRWTSPACRVHSVRGAVLALLASWLRKPQAAPGPPDPNRPHNFTPRLDDLRRCSLCNFMKDAARHQQKG